MEEELEVSCMITKEFEDIADNFRNITFRKGDLNPNTHGQIILEKL